MRTFAFAIALAALPAVGLSLGYQGGGPFFVPPGHTGSKVMTTMGPTTADFDGDGLPDIVMGDHFYSSTYILFNRPDSATGFQAMEISGVVGRLIYPRTYDVADMDRNGVLDIMGNTSSASKWLELKYPFYEGGSVEHFISYRISSLTDTYSFQSVMAALNKDGYPDMVGILPKGTIEIFLNPKDPASTGWTDGRVVTQGVMALARPYCLVGDLDGDGIPEIVATHLDTVSPTPQTLDIFKGVLDGTTLSYELHSLTVMNAGVRGLADFDNDGADDILLAQSILKNNGGLNFTEIPLGFTVPAASLADVDMDGNLDIGSFELTKATDTSATFRVYLGDGNMRFSPVYSAGSVPWYGDRPPQFWTYGHDQLPSIVTGSRQFNTMHRSKTPDTLVASSTLNLAGYNPANQQATVSVTLQHVENPPAASGTLKAINVRGVTFLNDEMPYEVPATGETSTVKFPVVLDPNLYCEDYAKWQIAPSGNWTAKYSTYFARPYEGGGQHVVLTKTGVDPIPIPDKDQVIITVPVQFHSQIITGVRLRMTIRHPYRGDIDVAYAGPNGTRTLFTGSAGDRADDVLLDSVVSTYSIANPVQSFSFVVKDKSQGDTGYIDSYSYDFTMDYEACRSDTPTIASQFLGGFTSTKSPDMNGDGVYDAADLVLPTG